jgi:hypothetical protein
MAAASSRAEEEQVDTRFEVDYPTYPTQKDSAGLKRDTAYFMGYQLATVGFLFFMPEGVSGWSEEAKEEYSWQKWWDNVQDPTWDKDDHYINYILHPYWGAAYYVRARDRGYDGEEAFFYSFLMSSMFEFGVEALFEQPSIQDLIVTPLGGLIAGEYFYRTHKRVRARLAAGAERTWKDQAILIATDPLGMLNRKVDQLFGREADFTMRTFATHAPVLPMMLGPQGDSSLPLPQRTEKIIGVQFKLVF